MKNVFSDIAHALPVIAVVGAVGVASCGRIDPVKRQPEKSIVVIHSWDSVGEEGAPFTEVMQREFHEQGVNANIHHIYANMVRRPDTVFTRFDWPAYRDSIKRWKPDVILLNDDPILEWVFKHREMNSMFVNTPCVFAGVNVLSRSQLDYFPKMTGYEAVIDWGRNMELVQKYGGRQAMIIELDYTSHDQHLRKQLLQAMQDSLRYVDNTNFRMTSFDHDMLATKYAGHLVVNPVSCAEPYMNRNEEETDSVGRMRLWNIMQKADKMTHLKVKQDIFSNTLVKRTKRPQFTAIREGFGDPDAPYYLCGYFTSMETQVKDQVSYAVQILSGQDPRMLPVGMHMCDYYMDWNAMQTTQPKMSYAVYSTKFNIVNAPVYLSNPLTFTLWVAGILLVVGAVVWCIVYFLSRWKRQGQKKLLADLQYEDEILDLVFSNAKDTLWSLTDDVIVVGQNFADYYGMEHHHVSVEEFGQMMHEDSKASFDFFMNFRQQRGRKTIRLHLTPDGGKSWYWFKMMYADTKESAESGELYGMMMNIDDKKKVEDQLEEAQQLASQVALKENFLANISHDLRTPLGAVTGFSSMLTVPGMTFEPGEREMYLEYIHQNTDMILNMIDSVMEKAQIETGDLEIIQKPVSVCKLVNDCYNTNRIIAPSHLSFYLEMGDPDVIVNIDMTRTKQVVNNFLSNSFKFTTEGSITLGWRHLDDEAEGMIEVYVKDTGIGVPADKVDKIFDRYSKVNENDKGTGLGLNISKTIIEKQGGTIGVESEFGKGSKFFFRLTRFVQCIVLALTLGLGLLMPSSCSGGGAKDDKAVKVLVLHSYSRDYVSYRTFDDVLKGDFLDEYSNADIRYVYMSLENPATSTDALREEVRDSLFDQGWVPDVILVEGDRAAVEFFNAEDKPLAALANVPVVLGGIHHPEWERIRSRRNVVVINDPIDYCANINLAVEMTGKSCVEIELDYFHQDSIIREELTQAIARPPFVDDSDFHVKNFYATSFDELCKDSIIVLTLSAECPERNSSELMDKEDAFKHLGMLYTHSWKYPSLVVKRDVYARSFVDKTGKPQFTAVKAGFADGSGSFLCGYFAGYETVAEDLARVGVRILDGDDLASFVGLKHEKHFYMDYAAMKRLGLKYEDYSKRFTIVGAPKEVTMPFFSYLTWMLIAMVFVVAVLSIMLVVYTWNDRTMRHLMASVKRRSDMRHMALSGSDSHTIRSEQSVKDIIACIHPDYAQEVPLMIQSISVKGVHKYEIFADIEKDGNYRWWQLRFVVVHEDGVESAEESGKHVDGILINIDKTKKYEEELRKAMQLAEEARQKEDFMTTISHEIRTPLNAVVGFSDVLVSLPQDSFSAEELMQYDKVIKTNNAALSAMIENILMFSRIESGRIQYVKDEFNVSDLFREIESEWRDLVPDGIVFETLAMRKDIYMNNDRMRVKYVIGQLLSNAFKFTKTGSVAMGLHYSLNDDRARLFVTDSGIGIERDKQEAVFDLFWKDDGFTQGLGLGLTVARKLAVGMGLKLTFESKEGFGSNVALEGDAYLKKKDEGQA